MIDWLGCCRNGSPTIKTYEGAYWALKTRATFPAIKGKPQGKGKTLVPERGGKKSMLDPLNMVQHNSAEKKYYRGPSSSWTMGTILMSKCVQQTKYQKNAPFPYFPFLNHHVGFLHVYPIIFDVFCSVTLWLWGSDYIGCNGKGDGWSGGTVKVFFMSDIRYFHAMVPIHISVVVARAKLRY